MPLSPAARDALRGRLPDAALLPFAEAVANQLAHPPGHCGDRNAEWAAVDRVIGIVEGAGTRDLAPALLRDPALLAAVFQNLDLLPPGSHHLPVAVMTALERAGGDSS